MDASISYLLTPPRPSPLLSINVCDNHIWKDRGQETTISITNSTSIEELKATLSKHFRYSRPIVLRTPLFGEGRPSSPASPTGRPGSPGSPPSQKKHSFISGGSAFANMLMDQDEAQEIKTDQDLKVALGRWSDESHNRRRGRVEVIR